MAKKILVVDDDKDFLQLSTDLLKGQKYEVRTAISGEESLETVLQEMPDLILLDYMLPPGINGIEILHRLKKDSRLKAIPVVMCSATKTTRIDIENAKSAGAVDYIVKPFTAKDFLKRIETALSSK